MRATEEEEEEEEEEEKKKMKKKKKKKKTLQLYLTITTQDMGAMNLKSCNRCTNYKIKNRSKFHKLVI